MKINMTKREWTRFSERFSELYPDIEIKLLSCDDVLERLGFCDSAPCVVSVSIASDAHERLLDELMQIEVDAFSTEDGKYPKETDPLYQKYLKYGWLWDVLNFAKHNTEKNSGGKQYASDQGTAGPY